MIQREQPKPLSDRQSISGRPSRFRPLLYVLVGTAMVIQVAQWCALGLLPKPLGFSNLMQVLLPIVASLICMVERAEVKDQFRRSAWALLSGAFAFWTVAEVSYLIELHYVGRFHIATWPDDVLWLLFAIPILLVTSRSVERKNGWIATFDHGQAFIFFAVLLASVFCVPRALDFNTANLLQNTTLLLSCVLRIASTDDAEDLSFYCNLAIYLAIYGLCAGVGNALQSFGMTPGSWVDALWTLPITVFCLLPLRKLLITSSPKHHMRVGLSHLAQGLSALGLASLTVGASAAVISRHPAIGYTSLLSAFVLFAVRTIVRDLQSYKAQDRLLNSALRDPLTGLGNRGRFHSYIAALAREPLTREMKVALMFVDLDRFKSVNDQFGHAGGDFVLCEVARRLVSVNRGVDLVCRLGGDEFVVAMMVEGEVVAKLRAEYMLKALREPFVFDDMPVQMTASIGIVLGNPGDDVGALLKTADDAMYGAKRLGKDQAQVFDEAFILAMNAQWSLEKQLMNDVEEETIGVFFQPIYCLQTQRIVGLEALARWTHPERGSVGPGEFIPIAEKSDLIEKLGNQVLSKACHHVATWNKIFGLDLFVSVNVSVRQFENDALLPELLRIIGRSGLELNRVHLEITESVLLHDNTGIERTLVEARALGMGISLDDFGTGYSSLSYLLNLPVDEIKIDQSFIRDLHVDPRRVELVRAVLNLGETLGKRVVAEGLERSDQLAILQKLGCEYVQGYLVSEPLDPDQTTLLLGSELYLFDRGRSLHEVI